MEERIIITKPGGYSSLVKEKFQPRKPEPHEVVIDVHAIGVNYADSIIRMGLYKSAKVLHGYPICPGFEISGVIKEVGADVKNFKTGQMVVGLSRFHSYATSVTVPVSQIIALPNKLDMAQGAAFPTVFLTAWYASNILGGVREHQKVLIHSASGGVGSSLVQFCKMAGATVVGVVGGQHKLDYANSLGADYVIDKSNDDLWGEARRLAPDGYDIVFDANGIATLKQSYNSLSQPGRLVIYGFHSMLPKADQKFNWIKIAYAYLSTLKFSPYDLTEKNRSVLGFNLSFLFDKVELLKPGMDAIEKGLSSGLLKVPEITTFPFDDVIEAHKRIESGQSTGKLVLLTSKVRKV